jgi:hypothetical protein
MGVVYVMTASLAEIAIVAGDPVLAGRREDIEVESVFEGFGGVRQVSGDDEEFTGADGFFFERVIRTEGETQSALDDEGDLFVMMRVAGDLATLFEHDAGDHGLRPGDELAGEQRVHGFGGNIGPAGVGGFGGHETRLQECRVRVLEVRGC